MKRPIDYEYQPERDILIINTEMCLWSVFNKKEMGWEGDGEEEWKEFVRERNEEFQDETGRIGREMVIQWQEKRRKKGKEEEEEEGEEEEERMKGEAKRNRNRAKTRRRTKTESK